MSGVSAVFNSTRKRPAVNVASWPVVAPPVTEVEEVAVQTSNSDIFGNITARLKRSFSRDSNTQQVSMVDDDQGAPEPQNKKASQSTSSNVATLFRNMLTRSGAKAASSGALQQVSSFEDSLLDNSM